VEVAQTMYTHVNKCKNYKIKGEKEKKRIDIQHSVTCHQNSPRKCLLEIYFSLYIMELAGN
jgi:hypothetical protein